MKEFFLDNAKKLVFFSVLFFCLFLMIYVLFSPLFCVLQGFSYDNYRHYVTNHQLNKKLVFFGRCILTFFLQFSRPKNACGEQQSFVVPRLGIFSSHLADEKAKVLLSKSSRRSLFSSKATWKDRRRRLKFCASQPRLCS